MPITALDLVEAIQAAPEHAVAAGLLCWLPLLEAGFSGTITDSRGRTYHYQDGRRVAGHQTPDAQAGGRPPVPLARHSVAHVAQTIADHINGTHTITPDHVAQVRDAILGMSVADAHELRRQVGVRASGRKQELAAKIAERALGRRQGGSGPAVARPAPAIPAVSSRPAVQPAGVRVRFGDSGMRRRVRDTIGRDVSEGELGAMACAPAGAKVEVGRDPKGGFYTQVRHQGVTATRTFHRDDRGGLVCHNDYFEIDKDSPHKGTGADLFLNQVRQLHAAGVSRVETLAAGSGARLSAWEEGGKIGSRPYNGFITWPKLGYSGTIDETTFRGLPHEFQQRMGQSREIRDLMDMPGGANAWQKHGASITCTFDLSDGSRNRQALDRYIHERSQSRRETGSGTGPTTRPTA